MKTSSIKTSLWNCLVNPTVRLALGFPWDLRKLSKTYIVGTFYFFLGSLFPMLVWITSLLALTYFDSDLADTMINIMGTPDHKPRPEFLLSISLIGFVLGFKLELDYFRARLRADGVKFGSILPFHFRALHSGSFFVGALKALWRVVVAFLLVTVLELAVPLVFGTAKQPTVELLEALSGVSTLGFAFMAVVLAPLFEEVVFRGFLFQGLRTSLHKRWTASPRAADWAAMLLSGLIFAVVHLQFQPSILIVLTLVGVIAAELYRRTGSLLTCIMFHALLNGSAVLVAKL